LKKRYPVRHLPLKRIFDIFFSFFVLILTAPLFLCIALAIFISNPHYRSIFYQQKRVGRGGCLFNCIKFRTMHLDADKRLQSMLESNSSIKQEWLLYRKLKNDPRITVMGRFLRKTSLDELPQFLNVLKGDLSVVGPRPVVEEEVDIYYGKSAPQILSIRPGITGVWQVRGRSDTSYARRVGLDLFYVKKVSFGYDLKLILKTIPVIFFSKGAY
jgi:exopolysaccharide production protein ExoY